jgi:hypothetical protein
MGVNPETGKKFRRAEKSWPAGIWRRFPAGGPQAKSPAARAGLFACGKQFPHYLVID